MNRALEVKNKLAFINDAIQQPEALDLNRADVWEDLKERFSKADRIRISSLRSCINNLKQGASTLAHVYRVEDQIMQFLIGLNDQFSIVKTQILLMDPLPSLNKVYSLVIQEESNHTPILSLPTDESNILVNAADSKKSYRRDQEIPLPPLKDPLIVLQLNLEMLVTLSMGIGDSGFSISQDRYEHLVNLLQQATLLSSAVSPSVSTSNQLTTSPSMPIVPYQSGIQSAFSCSFHVNSLPIWIIDSGANDHVCFSKSHFTTFYKISFH
ncbi:hypothetical protein MTR_6g477740 [Medicago truncatula]|uniref:Uncharacterized protein n=1 Tax=Medicago truncatula TaxID=3880 RepID=A0A072UAM6_MEDTR|nr:hypothetical protein MTR_6g477740 [Medicago truncatula]